MGGGPLTFFRLLNAQMVAGMAGWSVITAAAIWLTVEIMKRSTPYNLLPRPKEPLTVSDLM